MKHRQINPLHAPIVKIDVHLPLLPPERLSEEFLHVSFKKPPRHWDYATGDLRDVNPALVNRRAVQPAAVLIPIFKNGMLNSTQQSRRNDEPNEIGSSEFSVLFMQRSMHLRNYAGQVSFPGGKAEPIDKDMIATALRETQEEVGLAPDQVEVLGTLPPYKTRTAFNITPVVGLIKEPQRLKLCNHEVASAFTVPLAYLMNPANHRWHEYVFKLPDGSMQVWR